MSTKTKRIPKENMLRRLLNIKLISTGNIRGISNASISFHKEFNDQLPQHHFRGEQSEALRILESSELPELLRGLTVIKKHDVDPERLTQVIRKIFDLYKVDYDRHAHAVVDSPGFKNCLSILRFHAPKMMVNDLVTCLKVLISLKLNSHHKLVQQLLYHIKEEINELSLAQLAFLNYLLTKMEKTPLVSALTIALPIVFDLNVSMQLDHDNPDELRKLLKHVTSSNMKLSDKSVTNILSALILHGTSFDVECASQILWSLTSYNGKFLDSHDMVEKLVQNCIHVLNTKFDGTDFFRMELALDKLTKKYKYSNIAYYYSETFFNNCAKHVITHDLGFSIAYHVLRRFNDISFVNYALLDYIDQQIIQNHTHLTTLKMGSLMNLISAYSTANHKSENWTIIKSILHENPVLHDDLNMKYPLLKFTTELLSLDFVSKIFFDKVLEEHFLTEHLNQNSFNNFANFPQLRLINQALTLLHPEYDGILPDKMLLDVANDAIPTETLTTNERLTSLLESIFGEDRVQKNLRTKHGHLLEYVISFDNQQNAITMPCKVKCFEDLPKSQVKSIVVFFHGRKNSPINYPMKLKGVPLLRKKTLEAIGIREVDIALNCLELMHHEERRAYIEREIRLMLEN